MSDINITGDANGQFAGGNIHNLMVCPGRGHCPHDRDEAEAQRRFEDNTGIVCGAGERQALDYLMRSGFSYRQLALARRADTIQWDMTAKVLKAKVSRVEIIHGWFLALLGLFSAATGVFALIFHGNQPLTTPQILDSVLLMAIVTVVPIASRFLIRPNQLARHAKPLLLEFYTKDG